MKKRIFTSATICSIIFLCLINLNLKSNYTSIDFSLGNISMLSKATAECTQIWEDKDGDGIKEEYVYYCNDNDDPWWTEDDRWTLSDYPCISNASGSFSIKWNLESKTFSVTASGSYSVDHYVSKCGAGGDLTSCWAEMC